MDKYDVIVIGSGSGMEIVNGALSQGLRVALIDKGPLGGTCLNFGCIPSKMLIYPADRIREIKESEKLGIGAEVKDIDFDSIMNRMRDIVERGRKGMEKGIKKSPIEYYKEKTHFVDNYTLKVEDKTLKGEKIFIAAGARPAIPSIENIENVDYLTNESILELEKKPKSIIIIGGGYMGSEYAHFLDAIGIEVNLIGRNKYLVPDEEPEISKLLEEKLGERMDVRTGTEAVKVEKKETGYQVTVKDVETKEEDVLKAEEIMLATGRKPNSDLLKLGNTGVVTDEKGFIKVNESLETTKKNIWAIGDINGNAMFKHVANKEAVLAWHNSIHDHNASIDYNNVPHAIFSWPQIASVGLTEKEAKEDYEILVGKANYSDVAKGEAMVEKDGFAKVILDKKSREILGFHIIGPYAPILIQEVVNAISIKGSLHLVAQGMHIHPALPELIIRTLSNLREV